MRWRAFEVCLVAAAAGCGDPAATGGDLAMGGEDLAMGGGDLAGGTGDLAIGATLKRASKSSAIAISDDDRIVAAVSPDDDTLYLIDTTNGNAKVPVKLAAKAEPRSVAFSPDGSFWVANRGDGTIVRVSAIDTPTPMVGAPIAVGSEPTGLAVSPNGSTVVVANYADGTVSLIDAAGKVRSVAVGANPRAVAITNDGDRDDGDETAYVTLMFAAPVGGNVPSEGNDVGREGRVIPVKLDGTVGNPVKLAPIADTTFKVPNRANQPIVVGAYPNQLQAIALHNGHAYIPSTAASPAGPVNNAGNVHPFVSVFNQMSGVERAFAASGANANTRCGTAIADKTPGYGAGTVDLAIQVRDLNGMATPPPVLFPTLPVDIAFVPQANLDVGYLVSMSSDVVLRVVWDFATNTACAGSSVQKAIGLQAMPGDIKVPIGIVTRNDTAGAYVNSWVGREVEQIDFASQTVSARIPLSPQPMADPEKTVQRGKKFFWTSTGRWSRTGWGSCGACHPDGLSDNVTFVFAAGPRQTLPMDSDYGKNAQGVADPTDHRILNWTAIFDEIHDFENNTRGVSGGLGAVVSVTNKPINLAATLDNGLNGSVKQLAADGNTPRAVVDPNNMMPPPERVDVAVAADWDAIDAYVRTLRSLRGPSGSDPASVKAGRMLFETARCQNCHAGPKWTTSRRHYAPTQGAGTGSATCTLQTTPLVKKSVPAMGAKAQSSDAFHLATERTARSCVATADCDAAGLIGATCKAGFCAVGPQRLSCSLRAVGTFGAGPQGAALEVKSDTDMMGRGQVAQGVAGFNIPSLLSLSATAPYLHHGAAQTLADLFTNKAFQDHWTAGNVNFAPDSQQAKDLAAFLLSIDQATPTFPVDANFDLCAPVSPNMAAVCTNP